MTSLSKHQGDYTAASANVQYPLSIIKCTPGAQQYAIRSDLHGGAIVVDRKLLEPEEAHGYGKAFITALVSPSISNP